MRGRNARYRLSVSASLLALMPSVAIALPVLGRVIAGQATVHYDGSRVIINQTSDSAVLEWKSFDIGNNESAQFVTQNAAAITLNRVRSATTSKIDGRLLSNGGVALISTSSFLIGKQGRVDVGSLLAATNTSRNLDFLKTGENQASARPRRDLVDNEGRIQVATGGIVDLVARKVVNNGIIEARLATVKLGAGRSDTDDLSNVKVRFEESPAPGISTQFVANHGSIFADGGTVTLTTERSGVGTAGFLDMDGFIEANSTKDKTGRVILKTDGTTRFSGRIAARGGLIGRNGGYAEVSGGELKFTGVVDLGATKGKTGTLLVDPSDLYITLDGYAPAQGASVISTAVLETLLATNNVTIRTDSKGKQAGDINVADPFSFSSGNSLTLDAFRNINFSASLNISNSGGLVLVTNDGNPKQDGNLNFINGSSVSYAGGTGSLAVNGNAYTLASNIPTLISDIAGQTGSGYYALANNIDATGQFYTYGIALLSGTLEGLGHTISNPTLGNFFIYYLESGGMMENVGFVNTSVSDTEGYTVNGLVVENLGTIRNSYIAGQVAGNGTIGGLVGLNGGLISQSYSTALVSGVAAGGLVGANTGTIEQSYASGAATSTNPGVAGGLVAENAGVIDQSYTTGATTSVGAGEPNEPNYVGGFAGYNTSNGSIANSAWDTQTTGQVVGIGENDGSFSRLNGLTTSKLMAKLPPGFSGEVWGIIPDESFPYLLWEIPPSSTEDTLTSALRTQAAADASDVCYPGHTANVGVAPGSTTGGLGVPTGLVVLGIAIYTAERIAEQAARPNDNADANPTYIVRGGESKAVDLIKNFSLLKYPNMDSKIPKGSYGNSALSEPPDATFTQIACNAPDRVISSKKPGQISYTTAKILALNGFPYYVTPTSNIPTHVDIVTPGETSLSEKSADLLSSLFERANNPKKFGLCP